MFLEIKQDEFLITDALARISVYTFTYLNPEENLLQKEIEKVENELSNKQNIQILI